MLLQAPTAGPLRGPLVQALSKSDKEVLWARDRLANVGSQPPQGFASQLGQQRLPFAGAVSYPGGRQYLPGTRFDPTQLAASRQYAVRLPCRNLSSWQACSAWWRQVLRQALARNMATGQQIQP